MTTASFIHIDTASYQGKPWSKVDGPGTNFAQKSHSRAVSNLRALSQGFTTDNAGFAVYTSPAKEKLFTDDTAVREGYYREVENLLREKLPGVKKVVIFDHTIRRRKKDAPRQPVQQVHVDQTPAAAEARVRRHLPKDEADELVKGRYQIINVWRPIEHPASDMPLAVIDWRSTSPSDFIATDLLYPRRADSADVITDVDDRGKEVLPDPNSYTSTAGYEVRGETMAVAPSEQHKFYYQKDMTPDEVLLLKCFDSHGEGMVPDGRQGIAVRTPHTAFRDPQTPGGAPGRQSIEVRCLVFYE
ncbi:Nn.00g101300.m01.CDS01 [Neocucurbitaria sp. VM-36]